MAFLMIFCRVPMLWLLSFLYLSWNYLSILHYDASESMWAQYSESPWAFFSLLQLWPIVLFCNTSFIRRAPVEIWLAPARAKAISAFGYKYLLMFVISCISFVAMFDVYYIQVLLAISEIFTNIAGLEHAYNEAPARMKSMVLGVYVMMVGLGAV